MKTRFIIALTLLLTQTPVFAIPLHVAREEVAHRYLQDLQHADYKDIVQLFAKDGYVISTSRGKVDAKAFFYSFLPEIATAKTDLHQLFRNVDDENVMAARFLFKYKMKDGESGAGEYVDEFTFAENSTKLTAVYMFENMKFEAA